MSCLATADQILKFEVRSLKGRKGKESENNVRRRDVPICLLLVCERWTLGRLAKVPTKDLQDRLLSEPPIVAEDEGHAIILLPR